MARPASPRPRRDRRVHTYLTDHDAERLTAAAEANDMSTAAVARRLIRQGLDGLTASAAPPEAGGDG